MSASSAPAGAHTGPPGGAARAAGGTGGSAGTGGGARPGTGARNGAGAGPTGASFLNPPDPAGGPRRLYRSSEGRWVGGVARGLAGHLGLPVLWVRVLFLTLASFNGIGVLLYAVFW